MYSLAAPSSSPSNLTLVRKSPTSITVNWTYQYEAISGYVVYMDGTIVETIGGKRNEYTLYGLIPGTSHSVAVQAYLDILGPASTIVVTTVEGIHIPYRRKGNISFHQ